MFEGAFTLSNFYMIAGFLLSMYACVSNDIIQTLGTFTKEYYGKNKTVIKTFNKSDSSG